MFYNTNDWYNHNNRITVTINEDGSITIENLTNSIAYYLANYLDTPKSVIADLLDWDAPLAIEFQLIEQTSGLMHFNDGTTDVSRTFNSLDVDNGTILIKFLQDKIEYYFYSLFFILQ